MNDVTKGIIIILMVLYILSPVDVCPGPIDDLVVFFLCMAANSGINYIED